MTGAATAWHSANAYDAYVGRWSRRVAPEFLRWLARAEGLAWVDVGCGTGELVAAISSACQPASVLGVDPSDGFLSQARVRIMDPRVRFESGDASHLPCESSASDSTVSGLVLNFVRDSEAMMREMVRITRRGGTIAAYVWDYAGGMQMMRHFWDAAVAMNPDDAKLDQAERFPLCQPAPLAALFEQADLQSVSVRAIDVPTAFRDFDDFWTPFLGGTGAAPTYLASVSEELRERIRLHLASRLTPKGDGPIELTARAWAVRGVV
jgi:trans-aconitate methyltransferase